MNDMQTSSTAPVAPATPATPPAGRRRNPGLWLAAGIFVIGAVLLASTTTVGSDRIAVIQRFGAPVRVLTEPGLHWKWPMPLETAAAVDSRLHSTAAGRYTIQVADGSMFTVEASVFWQLPREKPAVLRYLQTVDGDAIAMAAQLRTLTGSALQSIAGRYRHEDFLNTAGVRLSEFERELAGAISTQASASYGIRIDEVVLERLLVPEAMHQATIAAMIKEREVLAEQRRARGLQQAGTILAEAKSQARQIVAEATIAAAQTIADARQDAAAQQAAVYAADPELYRFLRELSTLRESLGKRATLILRTDAGPLRHLGNDTPISNAPPIADALAEPEQRQP